MTLTQRRIVGLSSSPSKAAVLVAALALAALVLSGAPALAQSTSQLVPWDDEQEVGAPPDVRVSLRATSVFRYSGQRHAGTNPVLTDVDFSTMDYYVAADTGIEDGVLYVKAKTEDELNALPEPPDSPIKVTADVTMENDEGDSATHTVTFKTGYTKTPSEETP